MQCTGHPSTLCFSSLHTGFNTAPVGRLSVRRVSRHLRRNIGGRSVGLRCKAPKPTYKSRRATPVFNPGMRRRRRGVLSGFRRTAPVWSACVSAAKAARVQTASAQNAAAPCTGFSRRRFGCSFAGYCFWASKRSDSHSSAKPQPKLTRVISTHSQVGQPYAIYPGCRYESQRWTSRPSSSKQHS